MLRFLVVYFRQRWNMFVLLRSLRRMDLILRFSRTIGQSPIYHFYPKFWKNVLCPKCILIFCKTTFSLHHNQLIVRTIVLRQPYCVSPTIFCKPPIKAKIPSLFYLTCQWRLTPLIMVLLNRLNQRFGFRHLALKWLASYLADRRQSVRIRSAISVDSQLCFGVPQGSVLGPVLFSMYVAPVEDIVLSHGLCPMFYAGDSQIYLTMQLGNRNV